MASSRAYTFCGLAALASWGTLPVLTKFIGPIPPFQITAMGFTVAFAAAWVQWLMSKQSPWQLAKQSRQAWLIGIYGLFGFHACYFTALSLIPPAEATLIIQLWPLLMLVMAAIWLKAPLHRHHLIGTLLSLGGVALLVISRQKITVAEPGHFLWLGYLMAGACALIWSSYSVLSRQLPSVSSHFMGWICGATAVLSWIVHWSFEKTVWPAHPLPGFMS